MMASTPTTIWNYAQARRGDPDTSHAAARSIKDITDAQQAVFEVFQQFGPMTDEQAWQRLIHVTISPSGARTRRHELVEAGLLRDTGERVRMLSHRWAVVWGLS